MIKTILTAAVLLGTASAAFAQAGGDSDANAYNRYPAYNMTATTRAPAPVFQSSNVALTNGSAVYAGRSFGRAGTGGARISVDRAAGITGTN